jgi:hypothetical protein
MKNFINISVLFIVLLGCSEVVANGSEHIRTESKDNMPQNFGVKKLETVFGSDDLDESYDAVCLMKYAACLQTSENSSEDKECKREYLLCQLEGLDMDDDYIVNPFYSFHE